MDALTQDWRAEARRRFVQELRFRPLSEPKPNSAVDRYDLQTACLDWCTFDYDFDFHVTIQSDEPLRENEELDVARRFGALVNFFCFGKRWQRFPAADRAFFAGVSESGITDNRHLHLLLRMPRTGRFALARLPWARTEQARWLSVWFTEKGRAKFVCPHGNIHFSRLYDERDRLKAADYVFKRFGARSNLILSTMFDPAIKGSPGCVRKAANVDSRPSDRKAASGVAPRRVNSA